MTTSRHVQLFHGTTKSRADRIDVEGWSSLDIAAELHALCLTHDVDLDAVQQNLRERYRYVTHAGREAWVSFAMSLEKADRWAQRGPEWLWEALEAIWYVQNDHHWHDGFPPEGHAWRFRGVAEDPLVVIEASLPISLLHHGGHKSADSPPVTEAQIDEYYAELPQVHFLPDVRARTPLGPECIRAIHPVARRVYIRDALGLLNVSPEELKELDESGKLGPMVPCGMGQDLSWRWEHVRSLAATQR